MPAPFQRRSDVLASNLLLDYLAFTYAWAVVNKYVLHRASLLDMDSKGVVLTIVVLASVYYWVRKGNLLAKLLVLALFAWQVIGPARDYKRLLPHLAHDPLGILHYALAYAVQGWALVLLFSKARPQPVQSPSVPLK